MIQFACVGLDHRHIYGMTEGLLAASAKCVGYYTRDEAAPLEGFTRRFPDVPRFDSPEILYQREDIQLVVCAGIPAERAEICILIKLADNLFAFRVSVEVQRHGFLLKPW